MKGKIIGLMAACLMLAGCGNNEEVKSEPLLHWSHKACVEEIASELDLLDYTYTVKQIEYDAGIADDEVYCFDITVTSNDKAYRYYCFAILDGDEVMYVDCDEWRSRL